MQVMADDSHDSTSVMMQDPPKWDAAPLLQDIHVSALQMRLKP